jgi:hypothetical protein
MASTHGLSPAFDEAVRKVVMMRTVMDDVPAGMASQAVNAGRAAGDCLRAAVATVLNLDPDDVPHFVQYVEHPEGTDSHLWWWALVGFCCAHGWRVDYAGEAPSGWSLADGVSARGHQHVVVAYDGEIVHDPHPEGGGLASITGWFTFERAAHFDGSPDAEDG